MVDPGIHAEMTILIQREKELEREIEELETDEIPLWTKRVALAEDKGLSELADQARERVVELKSRLAKARSEVDSIDMHKSMLRHESRRPSGNEVERAEALLEQVRLAGLVDPDRKDWDDLEKKALLEDSEKKSPHEDSEKKSLHEDSGAVFDFEDED